VLIFTLNKSHTYTSCVNNITFLLNTFFYNYLLYTLFILPVIFYRNIIIKKNKDVRRCYSSGPPNPEEARPIYTSLRGTPVNWDARYRPQ